MTTALGSRISPKRYGIVDAIDAQPLRAGLALLGVVWAAATLIGAYALAQPRYPFAGDWQELIYRGPLATLVSFWQRWDALWYQRIATAGYHAGDGSAAFFPLYPLLARGVSLPLGGTVLLGQLAVSAAAFVGVVALLWRLVRLERGDGATRDTPEALFAILLLVCFPVGFFLVAPFTESLFLLLTVATFLAARSRRLWLAGALGLLAALTRTQGVFLALPIAWEALRAHDLAGRTPLGAHPRVSPRILAAALPVGGIALFTLFQRFVVGAEGPGIATLGPWGYTLVAPWDAIGASVSYITASSTEFHARLVEALDLGALLGGAAIMIAGIRRLPFSYALYAVPSLAILFTREMYFSPLMSVGRYVLVIFPIFVLAGRWLAGHRRLAAATLVASALLEVVLFEYFVRWGFVG